MEKTQRLIDGEMKKLRSDIQPGQQLIDRWGTG